MARPTCCPPSVSACERLVGAYALAVVSADEPGTIVATRKDSPLVVGQGAEGAYVASDIIAMIDATRDVVVHERRRSWRALTPEGVTYYDRGRPGHRSPEGHAR